MNAPEKPAYPGGRAYGALLEISHANHEKRAPSARAVAILAEYFEQWVAEDGHRSFDHVLGFAAEGKGKTPFLEKMRQRLRDLFIGHLVGVLHAGGFTLPEACELVSAAVNRSSDTLMRKQCRQVGLIAPSTPRSRAGAAIEYLPAKSVRKVFDSLGGEKWARFAGYFGEDCEERRQLALLAVDDLSDPRVQENLNFLTDLQLCAGLPFRSVDEMRPAIPLDGLPPALAARLRGK